MKHLKLRLILQLITGGLGLMIVVFVSMVIVSVFWPYTKRSSEQSQKAIYNLKQTIHEQNEFSANDLMKAELSEVIYQVVLHDKDAKSYLKILLGVLFILFNVSVMCINNSFWLFRKMRREFKIAHQDYTSPGDSVTGKPATSRGEKPGR